MIIPIIAAGVVAAIILGIVFWPSGPDVPNVKLIDYTEDTKTISPGSKTFVKFRVQNEESTATDGIRVETTFKGNQNLNFFSIDRPVIQIGTLNKDKATSSEETVTITGNSLQGLSGIDADFSIDVYVGSTLTDHRDLRIHLGP